MLYDNLLNIFSHYYITIIDNILTFLVHMAPHIKHLLSNVIQTPDNWKLHLLQNWKDIVGELHTKVTIEKIHNNTLVLGVYDSCWLQELYMLSPILQKHINAKMDKPHIKQIRFKLTYHKKKTTIHCEKKEKKRTVKSVKLSSVEENALKKLDDPELKAAMKSFLIRCYQEKE